MSRIHTILENKHREAGRPLPGSDLSERQAQILRCIARTVAAKKYPPTIREIGDATVLASSSTVHAHVRSLRDRGYLRTEQAGTSLSRDLALTSKACAFLGDAEPSLAAAPPYVLVPLLETAADIRAFVNGRRTKLEQVGTGTAGKSHTP